MAHPLESLDSTASASFRIWLLREVRARLVEGPPFDSDSASPLMSAGSAVNATPRPHSSAWVLLGGRKRVRGCAA